MARRLTILIPLLLSCLIFAGFGGVNRVGLHGIAQGVGLRDQVGDGAVSPVDTIKITTRHTTYPNTAADDAGHILADAGYDYINESTDGSKIMWGYSLRSQPDVVQYDSTDPKRDYLIISRGGVAEDDRTWNTAQYLGGVWFDLTGLKQGMRVEEAYVNINVAFAASIELSDDTKAIWCRLDTLASHYAVTSQTAVAEGSADSNRFDMTWNDAVYNGGVGGTAWSPIIENMDDWHDFGPRSGNSVAGPDTLTVGELLRFDVTDALQQHLDNGMASDGALFWFYGTQALGNFILAAGIDPTYMNDSNSKGNPQLTVTATSKRGVRPWGGDKVPVAFTWDDNYDGQISIFTAISSRGKPFDAMASGTGMANASWDSLYSAEAANITLYPHSLTHTLLGEITAGTDSMNAEIARAWMVNAGRFTATVDTTGMLDYAWPGGEPNVDARYRLNAIRDMIRSGYRSARAASPRANSINAIGATSYLSWDYPVNLYNIGAPSMSVIFNDGGAAADWAFIREELLDYIDLHYTDYGRSALVLYGHAKTSFNEYVNATNVGIAYDVIDSLNCAEVWGYKRLVSLRRAGFVDPANISGYPNEIDDAAAKYDSLATADGVAWTDSVWVGPR